MTMTFPLADVTSALLGWLMGFLSLFLIMLVLIQRGKGGGLSGALGGPGGQSAFGSKAGDTFTWITVAVASIWGFVCAFTMWLLGTHAADLADDEGSVSTRPGDVQPDDLSIPAESADGIGPLDLPELGEVPPPTEFTPAESADSDAASDSTEAPMEDGESPASESSESETPGDGESSSEGEGDAATDESGGSSEDESS